MNYKPEELLAVVKGLSEQFTGKASTSVTYEKAQQLMGAVIYCIRAAEDREISTNEGTGKNDEPQKYGVANFDAMTAGDAYESGYNAVLEKTGRAKELYHEILSIFQSFRNQCLEDTIIKGMPEFFKWYDARFCPQDTVILMDYPVLALTEQSQGINAVYPYLKAILAEQLFLNRIENAYIRKVLEFYYPDYEKMIVNISYPIMKKILINMLLDIPIQRIELTKEEYGRLSRIIKENENAQLRSMLKTELKVLIFAQAETNIRGMSQECLNSAGVWEYFCGCIPNLVTELKNGVEYDSLENVI